MSQTRTASARHFMAIGILAAVLIVCFGIAVTPFLIARSYKARRADLDRQYRHYAGLVEQGKPQAIAGLNAGSPPDSRQVLFPGRTLGIASANMQNHMLAHLKRTGMELKTIETLAPEGSDAETLISIRLSMQGEIGAMKDFLHGIETGAPLVLIEDLSFRGIAPPPGVRGPVKLDISLLATGQMQRVEGNRDE